MGLLNLRSEKGTLIKFDFLSGKKKESKAIPATGRKGL
jgi:hypothetical protein